MSQPRPKPRMAPTPTTIAEQQYAVERLISLDAWSEQPLCPSSSAPVALLTKTVEVVQLEQLEQLVEPLQVEQVEQVVNPVQVAKPAKVAKPVQIAQQALVDPPVQQAQVKRAWEVVPEGTTHQYSFFMPKSLFLKSDHCWKRSGSTSMKEFVVQAIEAHCAKKLKEMGEKP